MMDTLHKLLTMITIFLMLVGIATMNSQIKEKLEELDEDLTQMEGTLKEIKEKFEEDE